MQAVAFLFYNSVKKLESQRRTFSNNVHGNNYGSDSDGDDDHDDSYRPSYEKYNGYNGFEDDTIDNAFEGDPEKTWNVD